ncbi:hypothetical protein K3181_01870 [Qipengyuania sp. YG27]|uniref:Uncharacterized protein n=1 Tax=Qipengyuania mesophila TaxID=2867246 RepID=A0ABS7JRC2_9SPHN|nr:hypothetical protein [Qipengyuania mesophila]MBX7500190.1 hypothetical protein [Qipengyuania mesophila]
MAYQVAEDDLLKILGVALVEIRATESLRTAQVLADIFHNVPAAVANRHPPEETLRRMLDCSDRHGEREYFDRFLSHYLSSTEVN